MPVRSMCLLANGFRDSGTNLRASATTTTASGTLSQNAQRQSCSTSQPADDRPRCRGDAEQPGPGADRGHPVVAAEGRLQDREAARHEQGGARGPAGLAPRSSTSTVGDNAHSDRGHAEAGDAHGIHAPSPEPVAQRAAEQDQGGQGQGVGVDDPLETGEVGVEVAPDRGQRDVDDRAVEQGDAAAEDGGREGEPTAVGLRRAARAGRPRSSSGTVVMPHRRTMASTRAG